MKRLLIIISVLLRGCGYQVSLPAGIAVQNDFLNDDVEKAIGFLNIGLENEVFIINDDGAVKIHCDADIYGNDQQRGIADWEGDTCDVKLNCYYEMLWPTIMHELFHCLGFEEHIESGSGCVFSMPPEANANGEVCPEMVEMFNDRYSDIIAPPDTH